MIISKVTKASECCCSCRHNIRKQNEKQAGIYCEPLRRFTMSYKRIGYLRQIWYIIKWRLKRHD